MMMLIVLVVRVEHLLVKFIFLSSIIKVCPFIFIFIVNAVYKYNQCGYATSAVYKYNSNHSRWDQALHFVVAMSVEADHILMIFIETHTMRNRKQCDLELFGFEIEFGFDIHAHCACALI